MKSTKTVVCLCGALIAACAVLFSGCGRNVGSVEEREGTVPGMQKARAKELEGDKLSAIALYKDVILKNPGVARAHLDMALLLDQYTNDFISAIYHYKRYLELRPGTEKRSMVEDRIRRAEQIFASSVFKVDSRTGDRMAALQKEIKKLQEQNQALKLQLEKQSTASLQQPAANGRARTQATGTGARTRTYTVESGDTLASIAMELYGDAKKWKQIADSNRNLLGESDKLKVGQVLVIP